MEIVEPEKPSGYYHYFEDHEEKHYLVFIGTIKNVSKEQQSLENIKCIIKINNKEYKGIVRVENKEKNDILSETEAGNEYKVYLFTEVADSVNAQPTAVVLYYNEMLRKSEKENSYRYETEISYPKRNQE